MCDGALWSAMMSTNLHTVGVQRQAYTRILSSGHKFVWSIPHVNKLMNNFLSGPWRLQETVRIARTWILSHCKTDVGNLSNEFDKSRRHFFNPPDWIIISFNAWASFGLSHSVYDSIFQAKVHFFTDKDHKAHHHETLLTIYSYSYRNVLNSIQINTKNKVF